MSFRVIYSVWIGLWLSLSACGASKGLEPIDLTDSIICDPKASRDCVSVTIGFVEERMNVEAELAKYKHALKACQEKL